MEFGTLAGVGGIFVAVIVSMILEGSSPMSILLLPALFLVFVGTFCAAMAGSLVRDLPTVARHAKKAFIGMCQRLHGLLASAQARGVEIRAMLGASFERLNADFGFSLALPDGPSLARFESDLSLIERNYVQYLGLTQALRLSQPKFMEQFRRMLVSKLRVVFETASGELEMWNKAASSLVDSQLRERRRGFRRRRESLERIQSAAGELELRLAELEAQDRRLQTYLARVGELTHALRGRAAQAPAQAEAGDLTQLNFPGSDEPASTSLHRAHA